MLKKLRIRYEIKKICDMSNIRYAISNSIQQKLWLWENIEGSVALSWLPLGISWFCIKVTGTVSVEARWVCSLTLVNGRILQVVSGPFCGAVQKQISTGKDSWYKVDSFTSHELALGEIRYVACSGTPQQDNFTVPTTTHASRLKSNLSPRGPLE